MPNHDHRRSLYFVHEELCFDFLKEGRPHCRKKEKKRETKERQAISEQR